MPTRRTLLWVLGAAGALAALVVGGGGWVYAGQLLPAPVRDRSLDSSATLTDRGTVLLPPDRRACLERVGLLLEGGAALVYSGPVVTGTCTGDPADRAVVERTIERITAGDPPIGQTVAARFDEYVQLAEPADVGLVAEEVDVALDDDLGAAPAWLVEGARPETVVFVHGRSGTRAESLRLLPAVVDAGYTALVVTHRNDRAGGPDTPDEVGRFGQEEWRDLAAAVRFARDRGAPEVVLVGYSQGGSLIGYLLREQGAEGIAGVVLDSPLLDLHRTLVQQARLRDIPEPLIPPILLGTRLWAQVRAGLDVADVDHVDTLAEAPIPLLLVHGTADDFVPPEPTATVAGRRQTRGRPVTLLQPEGVGHVEAWNADPEGYTAAVVGFLRQVMP